MARIITDYLEETSRLYPEKIAFSDEEKSLTFAEVRQSALCLATYFVENKIFKKPVAIYLDKGVDVVVSFMGCAYSGNFYSPLDSDMPISRAKNIIETLQPECIITCEKYADKVKELSNSASVVKLEDILNQEADEKMVLACGKRIVETDILYILFTSGSTGNPKGVIISHHSAISYVNWATNTFQLDKDGILGNQTPFYFSMSVFDIYTTLKNASTMYIIPKRYFSNSETLLEYISEKKINLIYWVPSALMIVANGNALCKVDLSFVKKILFAGEVMPNKQLNIWRKNVPNALFANLFGPTEVTDICTYYIVDREFKDDESLPIGYPCENTDVLVFDENDNLIDSNEIDKVGELCVRGSCLAYGYYNNEEKTAEAFVQNPLNKSYHETVYRTGDLVKYNSYGEIMYIGRKDFQIKVSGYRIELGEIETAVSSVPEVDANCCVFDEKRQLIMCFFMGNEVDKKKIKTKIKEVLPRYMMPHKYIKLEKMPLNSNGKIDRIILKKEYIDKTNI